MNKYVNYESEGVLSIMNCYYISFSAVLQLSKLSCNHMVFLRKNNLILNTDF